MSKITNSQLQNKNNTFGDYSFSKKGRNDMNNFRSKENQAPKGTLTKGSTLNFEVKRFGLRYNPPTIGDYNLLNSL